MAKTDNEYWIYLEKLRRTGIVNMYGAGVYLETDFGLSKSEAYRILADWMEKYNSDDYEDEL